MILRLALLLGLLSASLSAQTIDDGAMIAKGHLFTGSFYSHESGDEYWEGSLNRDNGNVGTITTQTTTWYANYGVTNRLNVIAAIPYVWTNASQGVLQGLKGFQDITLSGKYNFFETPLTRHGTLRAIAVVSGGLPLTDYTPDFVLAVGSQSPRISARFTLNFQSNLGWFLNGSSGYTWRRHVTLDRPYYYDSTDDRLVLSDEVPMPSVFDYVALAGYTKDGLTAHFSFQQQRTQGGGDIRRQDMPFVNNRRNFSKAGGMVMFPVPKVPNLMGQFVYARTINGRNVLQANAFTIGLFYTISLNGRPTP